MTAVAGTAVPGAAGSGPAVRGAWPAPSPGVDVAACLAPWLATTDVVDEPDLHLALAAAARESSDDAVTALALLGAGRPDDVLALLGGHPDAQAEPEPRPDTSPVAVLNAAAWAARGNVPAYRWLGRAAEVHEEAGERPGLAALARAVAADHYGDVPAADEAWAGLVRLPQHRARTAVRTAVALVARAPRRGTGGVPLLHALCAAAPLLDRVGASDGPGLVLAAARELAGRGDSHGARLLLAAGAHITGDPVLRESAGAPPQGSEALRRGRSIGRGLLIVVLLLTAFPLGVLVAYLARQPGPDPTGLTTDERAALDGLATLYADPATGEYRDPSPERRRTAYLGLLGGFLACVAVVALPWPWLAPLATAMSPDGDLIAAWLLVPVGSALGALVGEPAVERARLRREHRAWVRARQHAHRVDLGPTTVCRCWWASRVDGAPAQAYADHHLVASADEAAAAEVAGLAPGASLRVCPTSGLPWLVGPLGPWRRPVALRGVLAARPDTTDEGPGLYL